MTPIILCEQFIYGMFSNIGYKLIKSDGVDRVLTKKSIDELCSLGQKLEKESVVQMLFKTEDVITVSFLEPTVDTMGRRGIWNHTIIISIPDYLKENPPYTLVKDKIIKKDESIRQLNPLVVG